MESYIDHFRKERLMLKSYHLLLMICVFASTTSSATATENMVTSRDGVRVTVQYDPLGPNNSIVAYVKFTNENNYSVEVTWKPVIICEKGNRREGAATVFDMNEDGTYVANIWRSTACGQGKIETIDVEIDVKRANP